MLTVVLTATFVQLLDVTIVVVALASIDHDLHATGGALELVVTAYTLAYACLLIPAARAGDRYGYRRMFVAGMTVFLFGSAVAAAAPDISVLIGARLLQGVGSAVMGPQVLSLLRTVVPADHRARATSWYGTTMGAASLLGPLVGGLLLGADVAGLGWRLIFLVNLPIGVGALVGARYLPRQAGRRADPVPLLGAVLLMAGIAALIFALSAGRDSGRVGWAGVCLLVSAMAPAGFLASRRRGARPLVNPAVVRDGAVRRGLGVVFVFNAAVPSFTLLLVHYLQRGEGKSALAAAAMAAPFAASAMVGAQSGPRLGRRLGAAVLTLAAASLAAVTGAIGCVVVVGAPLWMLLPLLALGGVVFGLFTASVFDIILAAVPDGADGSVSGLLPTAQQLGGTVGITLAGLCYFGTGATPATAFGYGAAYETVVFLAAAGCTLALRRSLNHLTTSPHNQDSATSAPTRRGPRNPCRQSRQREDVTDNAGAGRCNAT